MLDLFITVIVPIFILVGIGFLVGSLTELDLNSFSRILFWVYTPAILIVVILDTTIDASALSRIILFSLIQWGLTFALGFAAYGLSNIEVDRVTMAFGTAFINSGNLGLPLILLTFGESGLAAHTVVLVVQSLLMFTVGIVLIDPESTSVLRSTKQLVRVPVIWAIIAAGIMRALGIEIPDPLRIPLDQIYDGYIALALLALGAQLTQVKPAAALLAVTPALVLRLLVGPLVAWGLVLLLGLEGLPAQVLILGSGLPTAVNTYILSLEYNRDPDLASVLVFWSTLLSGITLPLLGAVVQAGM